MKWTDDRVALLRELWMDGNSAAQIARRLGETTRNAVMGKVHRLKLAARATKPAPIRRVRAAPARTRVRRPSPPVLSSAADEAERARIVRLDPRVFEGGAVATVLSVTREMCKFPIGHPNELSFAFCGRSACHGPYCYDHARIAYRGAR